MDSEWVAGDRYHRHLQDDDISISTNDRLELRTGRQSLGCASVGESGNLVKWWGSIPRSKTSPLSPNNVCRYQTLALSAVRQGSKGLEASYAEPDQGGNDHRLAHAVNVMGNTQSATAAQTNCG